MVCKCGLQEPLSRNFSVGVYTIAGTEDVPQSYSGIDVTFFRGTLEELHHPVADRAAGVWRVIGL